MQGHFPLRCEMDAEGLDDDIRTMGCRHGIGATRTMDGAGATHASPRRPPAAGAGRAFRPASAATCRLVVLAVAFLIAAVPVRPAGASERWFTVEMIVFDDLRGEGLHAEHWPAEPGEPPVDGAIELERLPGGQPDGAAHAFRLVNRSELSLTGVRNSLRRSAHYRPLLHAGWRLPGVRHGAARPAHVGARLAGNGADGDGERPTVRGTVKVSLARYLRVELDLLYVRPASGEVVAPETVPTRFRLVSERRMRSRELHYIDHPVFGVLVWIEPLRIEPEA